MMMGAMPKKCPACSQDMYVCLLRCPSCHTEIQGEFSLGRFAQLSSEQLSFLETFIRFRGNLKDVGAEIGISYPTARNRLDNLIEALGFGDTNAETTRRLTILGQLKEGTITAEEALTQLQGGNEK